MTKAVFYLRLGLQVLYATKRCLVQWILSCVPTFDLWDSYLKYSQYSLIGPVIVYTYRVCRFCRLTKENCRLIVSTDYPKGKEGLTKSLGQNTSRQIKAFLVEHLFLMFDAGFWDLEVLFFCLFSVQLFCFERLLDYYKLCFSFLRNRLSGKPEKRFFLFFRPKKNNCWVWRKFWSWRKKKRLFLFVWPVLFSFSPLTLFAIMLIAL